MATRKTPAGRKGQVAEKAACEAKEKTEPLTPLQRNQRWRANIEEKAKKGLPVPHRMNLILSHEAYVALEAIRAASGGTKTDVIASLLVDRAKRLKRSV